MCGLTAVLRRQPGVDAAVLRAANATLHHRGPDGEGLWVNEARTCGLGHVRLSIIDLAGGAQPLASPDGAVRAIVNGEFYDHDAIRRDLARDGYPFRSSSDSEILIPLYLRYGEACLEHLRGEFAFVLWDAHRQQLFVGRDRFGIKPLFYARHDDAVYVASEVKALLALGVPARWDVRTVFADETGFRNCSDTLFAGVKSVPPGHYLIVRDGEIGIHRYWDFDYPRSGELRRDALRHGRTEADCIQEFWGLLSEAVRLRLRADVPVGVYLSGGIDSSVVLALMREHTGSALDAFTLSFDHEHFDEGDIAREMAAFAGVRHTVIDIDAGVLAPHFEDTVWHDECPFSNANTIAKFLLSRHVRDAGLKVVLTGEGSDEVLGGYAHFSADMRAHIARGLLPTVARQVRVLRQTLGGLRPGRTAPAALSAEFAAVRAKLGFVPAQLLWTGKTAAAYAGLRGAGFADSLGDGPRFEALMDSLDAEQVSGRDPLNQSLYLSSKSMLPNRILTTLGDRVEMAHSIEARLPFLDHKVVEYLTRLPVELKIKVLRRDTIEKYLLKEAARGRVTETLYRRTKHPFTAPPTAAAADDAMAAFIADTLHSADMRALGFYDHAKVLDLHEAARARRVAVPSGVFMHLAGLAVMQRRFGLSTA
jgi:asparagine synthase (glutamine-hydrolysing)